MMQLFVITNSGTITVDASEGDSVLELKNRIQEKEGIPCSQQNLRFCTRSLRDHMSLRECKIDNNSTVSVLMELKGGVQIHVKAIGKGPSFSLEMELSDTVQNLKAKIEELQGIPPQDLKLAFRGKNLNDEAALNTINLLKSKGEATLVMTQKKRAITKKEKTGETETKKEEPAQLCANNCGFYGTASNGGYCSSCFKELGLVSENASKEPVKEEVKETEIKQEEEETDPSKIQTDTTHCWACNRKIGLLGFSCKCKYVFCAEHRYSDKHTCTFDYKGKGQEDLIKKLEKVKDQKGLHG